MSELDPSEATRREFEAVMRLPRFASIEQVAADLAALGDRPDRRSSPAPAAAAAGGPSLPSRTRRR